MRRNFIMLLVLLFFSLAASFAFTDEDIPMNVKYWHVAAKDSWFQHIPVEVPGEDTYIEWFGFLASGDYAKLK